MSELDPQGDVQLALTCPQCSHQWQAPLDIVVFHLERNPRLGHAALARRACAGFALRLERGGNSRAEPMAATGLSRIDRTMSDYLGNLVTRTLSQAAIVRPQLPSLFEPSAASGQIKSESEFEQETVSEPPQPHGTVMPIHRRF